MSETPTDAFGGESETQINLDYYLSLLRELEDKSELALELDDSAIGKLVIIDGDEPNEWWVSNVFAVDKETGDVVVTDRDPESTLYAFPHVSRVWDLDLAIDKVAEIEVIRREQALNGFIDSLGDAANPN